MDLKWMLRPSWRMAVTWIALMSGALALFREGLLTYAAATGQPVPALRAWEILGHAAFAAFVLSGLAVVSVEVRDRHAAETKLAELTARQREPDEGLGVVDSDGVPGREYVPEASGSAVLERYQTLRWNERDAVFLASYKDRWIRTETVISSINPEPSNGGGANVSLIDPASGRYTAWGFVRVPREQRHAVNHLEVGDRVLANLKIVGVSAGSLDLDLGSLKLLSKKNSK